MQVSNSFQTVSSPGYAPSFTKNNALIQSDVGSDLDLQKMVIEMLPKERKLGEFKDKDWVGEAKDLQIGPDIRFAVKSKNPDFLRRILWGPLTLAEFREVTHRVRELEKQQSDPDVNMIKGRVKGNIIDKKELIEPQSKSERTTKERSENSRLIIDIRL